MIDLAAPQVLLNRANRRAQLRYRLRCLHACIMAGMLCGLIIAGYAALMETLAAMPAIIAESAARAAG